MKIGFVGRTMVFLLIFSSGLFAKEGIPDSLTVENAIQLTLENNPLIQRTSRQIAASKARVEQSRSGFYPNAGANLSYSLVGPVPSLDFPGFGKIELFPQNNYDFAVSVGETVYDFGRRSAIVNLNSSQVQTAGDNLELVKQQLVHQTMSVFYSMLFLRQNIAVIDDQINTLNEHMTVTRKLVESGSATGFDTLTTKVRIAAAQNQKIDIKNSLRKLYVNLHRLLGIDDGTPLNLKGKLIFAAIAVNQDSLLSLALKNRFEMKISHDNEVTASLHQHLASLLNKPTLNAHAGYGFKNGYYPDLNKLMQNWQAGVQVQVPIFDGFLTKNKMAEAHVEYQAAKDQSRVVRDQIAADVLQSIADVKASKDKLATSSLQVDQAKAAVDIARVRYKSGVATNLDLLDAETELAQAKLMYSRALYEFVVSRINLQQAIGNSGWDKI